ncbi:rhodanese-like domain-containing protein [Neolewinella litorea]|uniref:Rhodanese-like domain-containing protein n=1 Tax=Neolewinella litorea TaxID=2562452 RepID=A0A4S4NHA4_9BACT|nr:rhodanese-like domain-containing protein [Neolewinella litorea]THH35470.1 rhodanese-like domain-containing protein [Neolewinella litorea]
MLDFLTKLFGGSNEKISPDTLAQGTIVDVRTRQEFQQGHREDSVNIPLQELEQSLPKMRQLNQHIITCCRSGNRSGIAARQLQANGIEAINGGRWDGL